MKRSMLAVSLAVAMLCVGAASSPAYATAQQEKMKTCNADASAKGLKGADRKSYMKTCLSAQGDAAGPMGDGSKLTPQQEKMKACNADAKAKQLKGGDRKKFMSDCLKGT